MLTTQQYTSYTKSDFEVWRILYERQRAGLDQQVWGSFFGALDALGLTAEAIPELDAFSDRLEELSGWRVQAVDGQLPGRDYWGLIADRRFPVITRLRPREELDHAILPDIFHDLFGHVPLVLDERYSAFLDGMGALAMKHIEHPDRLGAHGRVYKWTIEYGLIDEGSGPVVYGAGLISSSKEVAYALGPDPSRSPFSVEAAAATHHVPASLQATYFVIGSFVELVDCLPEVDRRLAA
jgi:phenylalanine-4-hydroxylase